MHVTQRLIVIILIALWQLPAQQITGTLQQNKNQTLTLTGFDYYNPVTLSKTKADRLGNFSLSYDGNYTGMGIISNEAGQRLILVLDGTSVTIKADHLEERDSLVFVNSVENQLFDKLSKRISLNDRAYVGWDYLRKVYDTEHFADQQQLRKQVHKALEHIEAENTQTLMQLPQDSYIFWYAPIRKLVSDMPQTINNYPQRIPNNIKVFRTTDLNNPKFKTSGIFRDLIEGHYLLLENMGQPLDSVYAQMEISTNYIINNLHNNKPLLEDVSQELFAFFEKRSLFKAAAYLSEHLLETYATTIDADLRSTMERYVTLKVGNTAPNIQLTPTKTLKNINNNILLVFGSGGCGHCIEDKAKLLNYYPKWQAKGNLEVVYISIDTEKAIYNQAYANTPWTTYCDFKGWDNQAVKDYFVNATPTYVLLDKDLKILLHPRSLEQVNVWVDYKLVGSN